jgi:hypothetical protein
MSRRFAGAGLSRRNARSFTGAGGPPYVGPMDGISVMPNGWWNVARRDFAAYTGPLIQVGRADTLAVQDIYPLADGWIDTASIASFCAGTTGHVTIEYDQSGNGRNMSSITVTHGPIIYTGGAGTVLGTKPSADFDGVSNHLTRADACGLTGATAYTKFQVCDADGYSTTLRAFSVQRESAGSGQACATIYESAASMSLRYGGPIQTYGSGIASGTALTPHWAISYLAAGAQIGTGTLEVSGQTPVETAETSPTVTLSLLDQRTTIGSGWSGGIGAFNFNGRISACGVWGSVLSAGDLVILRAGLNGLIV